MSSDKRYFQNWSCFADVLSAYPSCGLRDDEVLFAYYGDGSYCGSSIILFQRDGVLYENTDSHCSCNGLENWGPDVVTWEQLAMRNHFCFEEDDGSEAKKMVKALIRSHVPRA